MTLGTGEALMSLINENGEPSIVEKAFVLPPQSSMGSIDEFTRQNVINNSRFKGKYDELIDRESAFEIISRQMQEQKELEEQEQMQNIQNINRTSNNSSNNYSSRGPGRPRKSTAEKVFNQAKNSAINSFGRKLGNEIFKKLFK